MSATARARTGRVRVLVADDEPGLTELLAAAVTDAGRRPQILDRVRHTSFDGGNLVEVRNSSLRRRIDRDRAPMIHTMRGRGYAVPPGEDGR
ncbi:winged helix-turn-helix domain-containing protein [Streptomyces sp. NPDC048385]|uniref:winged helix-turn-helix domain-containing protein n=1 Tax=unclassified Streptomyces TaxID=2593676 RepID=UPI00344409CA